MLVTTHPTSLPSPLSQVFEFQTNPNLFLTMLSDNTKIEYIYCHPFSYTKPPYSEIISPIGHYHKPLLLLFRFLHFPVVPSSLNRNLLTNNTSPNLRPGYYFDDTDDKTSAPFINHRYTQYNVFLVLKPASK